MKRTTQTIRFGSVVCWALFAWTIAGETQLLPRLGDGAWMRWQAILMAGLVLHVSGDRLAEWRCRCCGAREVLLRALATRSHELLCRRCLHWNPATVPAPAPAPQAGLIP